MAQRAVVTLTDDLDGRQAAETVTFGLDGVSYEIDLSEKNAGKLRKMLAPYVGHARKLSRSGRPYRRTRAGYDSKAVRAWAASRGLDVPARGRIPRRVLEEYAERN
jgi:hypothetical protein